MLHGRSSCSISYGVELGLWALSAEHMTFGHGSVTYDVDTGGRHLIVRTNDDPAVFAGTDATLAQLRAAGIPVPTALAVDLSCRRYPFAWMVLEKIPGEIFATTCRR